ncbi:transcriptional regulator [Thermofilum sp.]|uniref:transcriptional regulator n=1 Tax=Thermofilum sp. TaxID=1961369 RepID=UPI0031625255
MRSIFELAYRYIEPAIRRQLVLELYKRGVDRRRIVELVGISSSLVTRYIAGQRGNMLDLTPYRDVTMLISQLAEKSMGMSKEQVEEQIYRIVLYFLSHKYFCNVHRVLVPDIDPTKCQICPSLFKNSSLSPELR